MDCERYANWISDAALGALDAERDAELRRHLLKCPGCQQKFNREQQLFSAMDRIMMRSVAAEPSVHFHVRVRQRIAEDAAAKARLSLPFGRLVAAMAACAFVIAGALAWRMVFPSAQHPKTLPAPAAAAVRGETAPPSLQHIGRIPNSAANKMRRARRGRVKSKRPERDATPEVLVPKDEMALVLELYNGVRTGKIDGASLLTTPPGFKREPDGTLVAAPLKIEPIKIAEIKPVGIPTELQ